MLKVNSKRNQTRSLHRFSIFFSISALFNFTALFVCIQKFIEPRSTTVQTFRVLDSTQNDASYKNKIVEANSSSSHFEISVNLHKAPNVDYIETQGTSTSDIATSGFSQERYLGTHEVNTRPAPLNEWKILREHIPEGQSSIELTVWVSASGDIVHYELIGSMTPQSWIKDALSEFSSTPMAPATLNDLPVPCKMSIVLDLE